MMVDFDELDRLGERADAALVWLTAREPDCTQFKEAAEARNARAVYHHALQNAAPYLIRLARAKPDLSASINTLHDLLRNHHDVVDVGAPNEHPSQGPNWAMRCTALLDEIEELIPRDVIAKERG